MMNKPFIHENNKLIRRIQSSRGGGIIVYIKKCYCVSEIMINESWEIISFKIKINKTLNNFIFAYKQPSKNDIEFIENLKTVIFNMNLTHELFINGDLNMNWLCEKRNKLRLFFFEIIVWSIL